MRAPGASHGLCARCARDWPARDPSLGSVGALPRGLAALHCARRYAGPLRRILLQAKEQRQSPLVPLLQRVLAETVRGPRLDPGAICVVPPSRRRRCSRWHLAEVLARGLRDELGWPLGPRLLRVEERLPQTALGGPARRRNLVRSFRAVPLRLGEVPDRVWVIDDVVTTGATLRECARSLHVLGVRHVGGLAVARAPEPARGLPKS